MSIKTSYNSAGSATSTDRGSNYVAWSSASNITSSNNVYTTSTTNTFTYGTDYLVAYNFGFSIPSNAEVIGLYVKVEGKVDIGDSVTVGYDFDRTSLSLSTIGTIYLASTDTIDEVIETWAPGSGPTPAQVNASTFAVGLWGIVFTDAVFSIDHISIAIEYQLPGSARVQFIGI